MTGSTLAEAFFGNPTRKSVAIAYSFCELDHRCEFGRIEPHDEDLLLPPQMALFQLFVSFPQ
jgi:hypothetical protein